MRNKNIAKGIVFILLGLSFFLFNTGIFGGFIQGYSFITFFWSLLLIYVFLKQALKYQFIWALFALTAILQINYPFFQEHLFTIDGFFPLYLGAFLMGYGLNKIFKNKRRGNMFMNKTIYVNGEEVKFGDPKFSSYKQDQEGHILIENNIGSQVRYVKSNNLNSMKIENNIGSLKVYLDDVKFAGSTCIINVENNMGQTDIYLPSNINVQNNLASNFGSIKGNRSFFSDEAYTTVFLEGESNFGEIRIFEL